MTKSKYIEDAARVADGRAAGFRKELEKQSPSDMATISTFWAGLAEAEMLAKMIRSLDEAPYSGDPYEVACERWKG